MLIRTVRASTIKLFACITLALTLCACLMLFTPKSEVIAVFGANGTKVFTNVKNESDRINFLRQFGWEVSPTLIEEKKIVIPENFDSVFAGYNELQQKQGLDLSRYKRKEVTRYTYEVTNYSGYGGRVFASLIVYRDRVIGGDLCTESSDGFIHGFAPDTRL